MHTLIPRVRHWSRLIFVLACPAFLGLPAHAAVVKACALKNFEYAKFTVCSFDESTEELRIVSSNARGTPLRKFDPLAASLGTQAARVRFAMNAGMFDDDGEAIGLLIEDGIQRHAINTADGPGNFHLKPNGVFSLDTDGTLHVETAQDFIARNAAPQWATQSGPMLVIDGKLHPKIAANGPSRNVRNGVGVSGPHTAYFVISETEVSFGKLARFFRDKLKCQNALYLDGSVSSLWAPALGRKDSSAYLGPMVVVLNR